MDEGWLCMLGSVCEQMKCKIYSFNLGKKLQRGRTDVQLFVLVANDVLYKFFVINGGTFRGKAGNVFYCALDSGKWEDTQLGCQQFLYQALCGEISKFYELYHWDDWREDVKNFSLDRMIFVLLPILWQDANVSLRLKDMKKDSIYVNEFFNFAFKSV